MNRMMQILFLSASFLSAGAASAAIFDSLESVDTLKVIAAQKTEKGDRMPASKVTESTKDEDSGNTKTSDDEKKN